MQISAKHFLTSARQVNYSLPHRTEVKSHRKQIDARTERVNGSCYLCDSVSPLFGEGVILFYSVRIDIKRTRVICENRERRLIGEGQAWGRVTNPAPLNDKYESTGSLAAGRYHGRLLAVALEAEARIEATATDYTGAASDPLNLRGVALSPTLNCPEHHKGTTKEVTNA